MGRPDQVWRIAGRLRSQRKSRPFLLYALRQSRPYHRTCRLSATSVPGTSLPISHVDIGVKAEVARTSRWSAPLMVDSFKQRF